MHTLRLITVDSTNPANELQLSHLVHFHDEQVILMEIQLEVETAYATENPKLYTEYQLEVEQMSTDSLNIEAKHLDNTCSSCERKFSEVKDFPLVRLESFELIGEDKLQLLKSNDKILKDFASMKERDLKELNLKREYCVDLLKWEEICTTESSKKNSVNESKSKSNGIPGIVFENFQQHVKSRSKVHQFHAPFDFVYTDPNTGEEWKTNYGNYDGKFGKATRWTCYLTCEPGEKAVQLLLVKYLQALEHELVDLQGKLVKGVQFLQDYLTGQHSQINLRHVQDDFYVLEYYLTTGHMGAFASIKESAGIITNLQLSCFVKK